MTQTIVPKVFISYSWDDETHKNWVKDFAARLRGDGVDVTIDRWSVNPGGQLPEFMERSVRENDYVLIVCTPNYKDKSDNRAGGVGYEGDIMTAEVLVYGNDEKFIPLLREGEWEQAAPSWLMGKYRIDLCGESYSEDSYNELTEYLFDRHEKPPPLGTAKLLKQRANSLIIGYTNNDKDFALWLTSQLISNGYPAWCNLLNPEPGEYTDSVIENSIKNNASKYLFVLSNVSNNDTSLLKQLRFAYEIMQNKKLIGFVVPLQITEMLDTDFNILLQGTSPIDFSNGWSRGINDLLAYLEKSKVARDPEFTPALANNLWRMQFDPDKGLKAEEERLLSNWFPVRLPEFIYFHELKRSGIGLLKVREDELPFPAFQHNIYLVAFANADDFVGMLGENISIKSTNQISLQDFLSGNYDQKFAKSELSWNFVSELLNNAWYRHFSQTSLEKYMLANKRVCFYFVNGFNDKGDNKVFFTGADGKRTWRFLVGKHKSNYWHFGIQGRAILYPEPAYIVKSHILVSNEGRNIWTSTDRLHSARRRWFRNWWNAEWRDRLLAAMFYLSTSEGVIEMQLGSDVPLPLSTEPLMFKSPVSYVDARDRLVSETDDEIEIIPEEDEFDTDEIEDNFEDDEL